MLYALILTFIRYAVLGGSCALTRESVYCRLKGKVMNTPLLQTAIDETDRSDE